MTGLCFTCSTQVDAYSAYCEPCVADQIKAQGGSELAAFDAYHRWADRVSGIAECDYCGQTGHGWQQHPEAHADVRAWQRVVAAETGARTTVAPTSDPAGWVW
jgi:hypothetical protein